MNPPAKTYPPKQESALASLHQLLCEADISIHHRLSIFYYLLLDFDGQDARTQYSTKFAEVSGVPKNYQILMRGLWLLDHQQFEVSRVPDARLETTLIFKRALSSTSPTPP